MLRRLLLAGSPIPAVAFALSLALAATAGADDVVLVPNSTVKNALGGRVKGAIQSESPTEVVVKLGANTTTVPTGEIASVKYDNEPPSLILAQSKEAAGLLAEASDLYKKAVSEASGKPFIAQAAQFHQAYALAQLALSDPSRASEAANQLESFVNAYPNGRHIVSALDTLARLQLQKGDYAVVEKTIARMDKQPQSTDRAAVLKAKVFAKQGNYEKAIAELDRLIQGAPEGSVRRREAQLARAECLVGQKKFAEAEAALRDVIKATPAEDAQVQSAAYNTLGDCLHAAGKPKDALWAYLHTDMLYAKDKEQHPRSLAHIARLWRELKHDDRADEYWQRLKQEYPASPWLTSARSTASANP